MEKLELPAIFMDFQQRKNPSPKNALVTHRILYDQTVERIGLLDQPAYSMQYHPETAPGSRDASYLFGRFLEMMKS